MGPERVAPRTPARGNARWTDPAAVAAQEAQRARSGTEQEATDLSSARLLRPTARPPQSGWRRLVYVLSGRLVNPGESPADIRRRELTARINQPLLGCYKIAMLSLKGGVGKTTMTATLGATFASLRGDRVVAVDANPDRGTLSQKIPLETSATVRHLLRDAQRVRRYTDVRAYTSQGPSRLEVLASEQDPAVSEAFSEDDYRRTVTLLEHFYNIVLTDCGTGLMHSAMYGVLGVADQLIIVSSGSIDGARSASATMDWLDAHGHGDLVRNSVAVINCVHRSGGVDLDRVAEHFAARCRAVVRIPFDAHLEEGAEVDLDRLEPATRLALLKLAAAVADAFEGAVV
jgi:MinD-like ATPase involved in chromosome partitioning or flagellar assembly